MCWSGLLADFGIWSPDFCAIEPQQSQTAEGWVIKVSIVGRAPILIEVSCAKELVRRLTEMEAIPIASRFQAEIERTHRYVRGRLGTEFR